MDAPFGFKHGLDPDLFALDRLDALVKRAPEGRFVAQLADSDRVRKGQDATYTTLEGSLAEDLSRRGLHLHFDNLEEWAPEYAEAGAGVLDQVREHEHSSTIHSPNIVIRVFSADAPAALHGDGNTQVNCGVGGRALWHFGPPSNLTPIEIESLMRGGMFLGWRELEPVQTFDLAVGDACAAPPRWPHWLEHPGSRARRLVRALLLDARDDPRAQGLRRELAAAAREARPEAARRPARRRQGAPLRPHRHGDGQGPRASRVGGSQRPSGTDCECHLDASERPPLSASGAPSRSPSAP